MNKQKQYLRVYLLACTVRYSGERSREEFVLGQQYENESQTRLWLLRKQQSQL